MESFKTPYVPWATWEEFQSEILIRPTEQPADLRGAIERVTLQRDDVYSLRAIGTGIVSKTKSVTESEERPPAGTSVPSFRLEGVDVGGFAYELECSHVSNHSETGRRVGDHWVGEFTLHLNPYQITRRRPADRIRESLTEWYLNGPRTPFLFTRNIEWRLAGSYHRRLRLEGEENREIFRAHGSQTGWGAFVSVGGWQFFLYEVPDKIGPSWSKKIAIEYREDWGGVPLSNQREAVAEFLSFIFGRRLLHVGTTEFDDDIMPYRAVGLNPRSFNPPRLCLEPDTPPITIVPIVSGKPGPIHSESGGHAPVLEEVLRSLLVSYLEKRDQLNLGEAMGRYLYLPDLYEDLRLPLMRTILETLANAWFKTNGSKSGGVYMPGKEMNALLCDDLTTIEAKLTTKLGDQLASRIVNRMRGSFQMGMGAKFDKFLEEIRVPIGHVEESAINAASGGAHAGRVLSDENVETLIRDAQALKTLLNRVILSLVGYEGNYIDYSAAGWPERDIAQPLSGRND